MLDGCCPPIGVRRCATACGYPDASPDGYPDASPDGYPDASPDGYLDPHPSADPDAKS